MVGMVAKTQPNPPPGQGKQFSRLLSPSDSESVARFQPSVRTTWANEMFLLSFIDGPLLPLFFGLLLIGWP